MPLALCELQVIFKMSCFSCLIPRPKDDQKKDTAKVQDCNCIPTPAHDDGVSLETRNWNGLYDGNRDDGTKARPKTPTSFTFGQLAVATRNFREANYIGAAGFGKVYKGQLETGELVTVKQLDREDCQVHRKFMAECFILILLRHSNLVTLIGYCLDGDQRLLVYEYMPKGSLEDHLFDPRPPAEPISWNARIKIAVDVARGLEFLHCGAYPDLPFIHWDLKSANILLDMNFNAKLSNFGLAKLGPVATHVSDSVMGTDGYCAPEYAMGGQLTPKSDIFSFGVMLLELITGRKAEQNIAAWGFPNLGDPRKIIQFADPLLQGRFPTHCLKYMLVIAGVCVQERPSNRPQISGIVSVLQYVAAQPYNPD
uniref:Protein kinase domain-containing protein n=1 Tax=Kalanchoe fedtschenkoi TaxID=63787 RepID=A0A7N0T080_KALFE